jgi:Coenzyme PQQ synthesis protein D (PqqD)
VTRSSAPHPIVVLPSPGPAVVCCEVEDGAVLLSTADEVYFGLNRVGLRIWRLLPPVHHELDDLCEVLAREYPEVERDLLRADVESLLADLLVNGLVVR